MSEAGAVDTESIAISWRRVVVAAIIFVSNNELNSQFTMLYGVLRIACIQH